MSENQSFLSQPRTILALALSLLALAEIVDLTIVAVALPNIRGSLNASLNEMSLTITCYIVAAAIFIPLTGIVTSKFGVKRVALVSALLFGISSIFCGLATSVTEMIIFRLLQGVGGAFLPSLAQAFIVNNFTGKDRSKMMSIFSSCVVLGPIIGPILGGAITEHMSWRWIFYVNVPICLAGFLIIYFFMEYTEIKQIKTDYISFLFMGIGIGCLEYFIDEGNTNNWFDSHNLIIVFTIAIIFIGFFIWRGLLGKSVVNFEVFKHRNYVLACMFVLLFVMVMAGGLTFFPTLLQQGYGLPVDTAGYITAPRGLASFLAAPIAMKLSQKFDPRRLIVIGLLIFATATYSLSHFSEQYDLTQITLTLLCQGFGMIFVFINLMQLTYTNLPVELNSDASGIYNFFRNIGSSIGTSIAATIIAHQQQASWHDLISNVNHFSNGYKTYAPGFAQAKSAGFIAGEITKQSFFISNLDVFHISLFGIIILVGISFLLDKPSRVSGELIMEH